MRRRPWKGAGVAWVAVILLASCSVLDDLLTDDDGDDVVPPAGLAACIADLAATLPANATYLASELELTVTCMIMLHPDQGRATSSWHPILHRIAREHTCDQAARNFTGHVDPDGFGPNYRATAAGFELPGSYGVGNADNNIESVMVTTFEPVSAQRAFDAWLGSPPHRSHVLAETNFTAAQAAVAAGYCPGTASSDWRHYWAFVSAPLP
jgi:hypothetical protein